ncbi:helix-turn-helix domain-containing protein [Tianweitania sediminis]|uniref:Helix-turn-helix transcriptional regulator n=1 Tax=Tianweitania sediminis TaxID=1502156 RepID=A0A8J7R3M8_9HYPH|nr:helix-turn-helix transcriptional regulator [Tianweitania sediminis]MBP0439540.1 helix-turn-helix transcriptional regulator [Tianweitania sediminis]
MFTHPQQGIAQDEVLRLRQEAGRWLKGKREAAGLSQRDLAKAVGIDYYTFISQIESGRGRVPPAQMRVWAEVLNIAAREFATTLMRFYDPLSYELIFGDELALQAAEQARDELEARIARLEGLIARK